MYTPPDAFAARTIPRHSSIEIAAGTSLNTCSPRSSASMACDAWRGMGVAMITPSRSDRSSISPNPTYCSEAPSSFAVAGSAPESMSHTACTRTQGRASQATRKLRPRPQAPAMPRWNCSWRVFMNGWLLRTAVSGSRPMYSPLILSVDSFRRPHPTNPIIVPIHAWSAPSITRVNPLPAVSSPARRSGACIRPGRSPARRAGPGARRFR